MAKPSSRSDLINYTKRQLGAPVLEINVADEQIDDLIDDALQIFQERHFDGVTKDYVKYKITQDDIDRGKGPGEDNPVGIVTTTIDKTVGVSTQFKFQENSNYLPLPPDIIGVEKIFHFDGSATSTNNMFSVKYQLFLNDIYYYGATQLMNYAMVRSYLSDIDFLLTTQKQFRFNQRQDRIYIDIDWSGVTEGDWLIFDVFKAIDPNASTGVWNDSFLKRYVTQLVKRQWGQNLMKFQGVKLPGGVELNGRQMYDDAEKELEIIREQMSNTYEVPPLDMIG
tara:strand:- start:84 stop:926 length:843 start_codon:yes stop_codon:yes gene_type:complete